ncbi:hypothetical protein TWF173_004822 [Orbilia oligospora]|nr:hypothetical protein TWF173_004822 [Orbilia oligospora]
MPEWELCGTTTSKAVHLQGSHSPTQEGPPRLSHSIVPELWIASANVTASRFNFLGAICVLLMTREGDIMYQYEAVCLDPEDFAVHQCLPTRILTLSFDPIEKFPKSVRSASPRSHKVWVHNTPVGPLGTILATRDAHLKDSKICKRKDSIAIASPFSG